jgi:hypothetical protein
LNVIAAPQLKRIISLLLGCKKGEPMFRRLSLAVLALGVGVAAGFALNHISNSQSVHAQESGQFLVEGHGRAISSLKLPGEQFTFTASNSPQRSFKIVPAGKKFVLTDVMYIAQGSVRQDVTVNIGNANPANQTHGILFQVRISTGESDEVHLCSGSTQPFGVRLFISLKCCDALCT